MTLRSILSYPKRLIAWLQGTRWKEVAYGYSRFTTPYGSNFVKIKARKHGILSRKIVRIEQDDLHCDNSPDLHGFFTVNDSVYNGLPKTARQIILNTLDKYATTLASAKGYHVRNPHGQWFLRPHERPLPVLA